QRQLSSRSCCTSSATSPKHLGYNQSPTHRVSDRIERKSEVLGIAVSPHRTRANEARPLRRRNDCKRWQPWPGRSSPPPRTSRPKAARATRSEPVRSRSSRWLISGRSLMIRGGGRLLTSMGGGGDISIMSPWNCLADLVLSHCPY